MVMTCVTLCMTVFFYLGGVKSDPLMLVFSESGGGTLPKGLLAFLLHWRI